MNIQWRVCPICGKTERLEVIPKERFTKIVEETDTCCVNIECKDCDIQLYDFDFDPSHQNYEKRLIRLAQKWNKIPRRAYA